MNHVNGGSTKEDLNIRMAELQKKLKDSEEERRMLEKTCEILMKTFKEEQRIYFNALNNKYEKFLEDCNIRQRRNDVIKRSLYKVEDKAKAIFEKTQKLKMLKDRYFLYLKQNEFLKVQDHNEEKIVKNAATSDAGSKSVHWKIPIVDSMDYKGYVINFNEGNQSLLPFTKDELLIDKNPELNDTNLEESSLLKRDTPKNLNRNLLSDFNNKTTIEVLNLDDLKSKTQFCYNQTLNYSPLNASVTQTSNISDENSYQTQFSTQPFKLNDANAGKKNENSFENSFSSSKNAGSLDLSQTLGEVTSGNDFLKKSDCLQKNDLETVKGIRENNSNEPHESIENFAGMVKDVKEDGVDNKINSDDDAANFEVNNKYQIAKSEKKDKNKSYNLNSTNYMFNEIDEFDRNSSSSEKQLVEEKFENQSNDADDTYKSYMKDKFSHDDEISTPNKKYLKGLDGVDYQNETYPESYYEQPVRSHNFSSLASKVILEEDEFELEQEEKEFGSSEENGKIIEEPKLQTQPETESSIVQNKINGDVEANLTKDNVQVIGSDNLLNLTKLPDSDDSIKSQIQGFEDKKKFFEDEEIQIETCDSKNADSSLKLDSDNRQNENNELKKISHKSNLMHLLESDSESFQIEHGEMVTGYDDSDFDFSFKQDLE